MQDIEFSQPNSQFESSQKGTISTSTNEIKQQNHLDKNTANTNSTYNSKTISFNPTTYIDYLPISNTFTTNSQHHINANGYFPNNQYISNTVSSITSPQHFSYSSSPIPSSQHFASSDGLFASHQHITSSSSPIPSPQHFTYSSSPNPRHKHFSNSNTFITNFQYFLNANKSVPRRQHFTNSDIFINHQKRKKELQFKNPIKVKDEILFNFLKDHSKTQAKVKFGVGFSRLNDS